MVISITSRGLAKRTPLNDYSTQRRGGVACLISYPAATTRWCRSCGTRQRQFVDPEYPRAFRVPLDTVPLTEVRGRGGSLPERLMFTSDEAIGCALALAMSLMTARIY